MCKGLFIGAAAITAIGYTFGAFADTGWSPAYIGAAAHGSYSDYGYDYDIDDYGAPGEHPSIRMADELVDIYLHRCGATVNAEFLFINDGDATTVDMFYPLSWGRKSNSGFDFELYRIKENGGLIPIEFDIFRDEEGESDFAKVARWSMQFGSGEEITIVCRYVAGYGWDTESNPVRPRWELENEGEGYVESGAIPYTARYIIRTGGAWRGPIEHGIVAFHTTDEIVWEDLINFKGKLHLNDSPGALYSDEGYVPYNLIPDEILNVFKRNDNIRINVADDALIVEFDDLEAGSESFDAVSDLLETGLPIFISGSVSGDVEVSLKPSASSTLPDTSDYWYKVRAMGYSSTGGFHAWSEGVPGNGEGEWVKVEIYAGEDEVKPVRLKGIHFYGGFHSGLEHPQNDLFYKNGAPSTVTVDLYRADEIVYTDSYNLAALSAKQSDSFSIGSVYLRFNGLVECEFVKVTIDEVRSGTEWDDTCISGIEPVLADGRVRHTASSCLIESPRDICRFHPIKIDDGDIDTCWVEGVPGNGIGEWVELEWESSQNLSNVFISSGFAGDEVLFRENTRPKQLKMELFSPSGAILNSSILELNDTKDIQAFPVGGGGLDGIKRVRLTIEDIYPGTKYDDTCIAEIDIK